MEKPGNQSCYRYLLESSAQAGEFTALTGSCAPVSITEFIRDTEYTAAYLAAVGIGKGDVCTIFLPTCGQAFVAFYAVNKIGAIANIVHPLTPPDVIAKIMTDTQSGLIFVLDMLYKPYEKLFEKFNSKVIVCSMADYATSIGKPLTKLAARARGGKAAKAVKTERAVSYASIVGGTMELEEAPETEGDAKETAVYLHGGGTTGKSKTIMLSSFAVNSLAHKISLLDTPHETGTELSLIVLPLFHAFGLAVAMHFSLCAGYGCVCMPEFSAKKANELIRKLPIAYIVGVPNMFKKMYSESNFMGPHLQKLRLMFSGGDTVSEEFVSQFNGAIASCGGTGRLMRGYGLTECCSVCCVNNFEQFRENSIGVPLQGLDLEIWDENKNPLSRNTIGEIVVSGDTLMNGYFQDGVVNESGIYTDENGKNWVLTGDLGYKDPDGFVFFTGRKKRIIVISGYNVYPYNVESCVLRLNYISEACAVQGYENDKPIVKLYVTLREPTMKPKKVEEEILAYCEHMLDRFSIPRKIVIIDAFPRTAIGKIDFLKLTDPIPNT